jgi:hypothetical protein
MKIEHEWAGAEWVERALRVQCSPLGRVVADILGFVYRGIYHLPTRMERVRWTDVHRIEVNVTDHMLSTFDGRVLTDLVVACHDCHIRLSIEACSPSYVKLVFDQRVPFVPGVSTSLSQPTMEEQVAFVRQSFRVTEGT